MLNFFVDDLKLYSQNLSSAKKQLDIIKTFSRDKYVVWGRQMCLSANRERKNDV